MRRPTAIWRLKRSNNHQLRWSLLCGWLGAPCLNISLLVPFFLGVAFSSLAECFLPTATARDRATARGKVGRSQ